MQNKVKKPAYGLVGHAFWANHKIQDDLSINAKLVALYLLSCPQIKPYGFIRISPKTLSEILHMDLHDVCVAIAECKEAKFLYCYVTGERLYIHIPLWFFWCGVEDYLKSAIEQSSLKKTRSSSYTTRQTTQPHQCVIKLQQQVSNLTNDIEELKQLILKQQTHCNCSACKPVNISCKYRFKK